MVVVVAVAIVVAALAALLLLGAWLCFTGHVQTNRIRSSPTPTLGHPSYA